MIQTILIFTPDKTLNVEAMGPYSFYELSKIAFSHYNPWFKDFYDQYPERSPWIISELEPDAKSLIEKYHKEVGYTEAQLDNESVNQF